MYSEEFYEPTINHTHNEKCCFKMNFPNDYTNDDQRSKGIITIVKSIVCGFNCNFLGGDSKLNADDEIDIDSDNVDHIPPFYSFPTYNNFRFGLPKGDFSFGENELDIELDALSLGTFYQQFYLLNLKKSTYY